MKTLTKFAALFVLLCSSLSTTAQDALPVVASIDRSIETVDSLALISEIQDTLPLPLVPTIPRSFQQTRENQIIDTLGKGKSIFTGDYNNSSGSFKIKEIEVFQVFK